MKKINKEILNRLTLDFYKFDTYLETIKTDTGRKEYYEQMFLYTPYPDMKTKKNLIKIIKSETIVSDLLISELKFKEKCLLDINLNNWYIYNKKYDGIWSPVKYLDISTFIFNGLEELFPSSIIAEFKISRLNTIQKTLALKLAVDLYKVKNKNIIYKNALYIDPYEEVKKRMENEQRIYGWQKDEKEDQIREEILNTSKPFNEKITSDLYVTRYYDKNRKSIFDEFAEYKIR